MKNSHHILVVCTILLLLLWIPVSVDKILQHAVFRASMIRQPFSDQLGIILSYVLPILEVLVVVLLVIQRVRLYGFALSFALLLVFSIYITMGLVGTWEKIPCGCGSVISGLSWKAHLLFNLLFLSISGIGFWSVSKVTRIE